MSVPHLAGIAPLIDRYDGFILDLWGVIHDGERPYDGVPECLDRLAAAGKRVCLLSNAPRRSASAARRLEVLGIGADRFQHLMTSGEATHEALRDRSDPWHAALGRRFLHIGPDRDHDVFETLDLEDVDSPEEAEFVLNTGILDYEHGLEVYEEVLQACAARRLPMICANPDLVVLVGDTMVICAGLLAQRYEALGGEVAYHGKPHAAVYRRCFELLEGIAAERLLAVGDSLRTDVAGANAAGIDVALVTGGIHREELGIAWGEACDPAALDRIVAASGHTPTYAIPRLVW